LSILRGLKTDLMKFAISKIDIFIQIAEYIMACILCLIFALYCSGRVGYFLLIVLLLSPALSWSYTFLLSRIIRIQFILEEAVLSKGSLVPARVKILKPAILPVPVMTLLIRTTGGIAQEKPKLRISSGIKREYTEQLNLRAVHASGAYAGIEGMQLLDFFGIVQFDIKHIDHNMYLVGILPEANDTVEIEKELQTVLEEASDIREYEESPFEKSGGFGGFPGYEHREYKPGDPIKRINYKLSAKRDELFVRLDEQQINGKVIISLERELPAYLEENKKVIYYEQQVEKKLGLAMLLLARQFVVEFRYFGNSKRIIPDGSVSPFEDGSGELRSFEIKDIAEISELSQKLAFCIYLNQR